MVHERKLGLAVVIFLLWLPTSVEEMLKDKTKTARAVVDLLAS